ncbi:MAG TPA: 1,4-alpha-glucan branching protein GlgB [Vicinamibacterales bacterium]|nr:1,4-alpha-glucan branching protein GlgB [Acidobacteriota bacterium]HOC17194.1 1,4-alpha-glucan branching protein GlgB [Vicinamibacterales bacterium]
MSHDDLLQAAAALEHGTHPDPFAVLGPHPRAGGRPGVVVRAFSPDAVAAELLPATLPPQPMARVGSSGLFHAAIEGWEGEPLAFDYRVRFTWPDGSASEVVDAYRFGRVLTDEDLYLIAEGTQYRAQDKLGARPLQFGIVSGVHFAVWAPNAERVSVVGDFNRWDGRRHPMRRLAPQGVWEIFIPGLANGEKYKFEIRARGGAVFQKTDPYARRLEVPPKSASIVWHPSPYPWQDREWMERRERENGWLERPVSIYEVHLGSWARGADGQRFLSYRELAERLVPYVRDAGFTHIELLPVMEHPFAGSWGYQVTGFFAPTSRFGVPEDFKAFVDACHLAGLGVLLDWVPGHFPKDAHALARFDGTALYEHEDPRLGEHQDWGTLIFNYGRHEVRSFLLSNALFWLEEFHVDGLRVDAVASMLYLDYSRREGQWIPNRYGGRENLEAIDFLRELNSLTHGKHPGTITAAEESTAWPGVSRPVHLGGLGFTYKWNMGWMHDMLSYMSHDPIHRRWAHNQITFSMLYAYHENFILPFSHDEVVHGKGALIGKMPGDSWQQAANLRALYGYMFGHPGKKLLFMGDEFGQRAEWNHDRGLEWEYLDVFPHGGVLALVRDLNALYRSQPALFEQDYDPAGFQWIDCNDNENSVVTFLRRARDPRDFLVFVLNLTPVPRQGYVVGVPEPGSYRELLNTDSELYGGSNLGNGGFVASEPVAAHGFSDRLRLVLPPLACLVLKIER